MDVTGHIPPAPDPPGPFPGAGTAARGAGPQPRPVSIRDVAAAAGVSYQTVSRVINDHPSVRDSTRQQVLAAIRDLGFSPNRAARTLAGGPAHSVTVLTSNTVRYGYAATLQGIEEAARAAGFAVGVRVVESDAPAEVRDAVRRAAEPGTALIVIAYDRAGTAALAAIPPETVVVAAVETPAGNGGEGQPWVWTNDRDAAEDATRYLLRLGHETVHYVPIPASTNASPRMAGWRSALERAGVSVPGPAAGGWEPRAGYEAGRRLAADPEVTAVLCGNDDLALGVLRAMYEAGRPVPGSVSVVGFDDMPRSAFLTPTLTTVRQDFAAQGRVCFGLLQNLLDPRPGTGRGTQLEAELIVRESTGPPPRR